MRAALAHRGPDDTGEHVSGDGRIGFINTRLAIRDLTPAAHMPMRSPDGRLCITYNGEIYNAEPLREDLRRLGYSFRSTSDTEVVLAGYQHWGDDVVRRLRGMFAFAIADSSDGVRVLLARDPLGIKPLYYTIAGELVAFASELRGLRAADVIDTTLDAAALSAYLQLGSVPAPLTIFRDASALEPGCMLVIDDAGHAHQHRYYELPECVPNEPRPDVLALLRDAVQSHMIADVPVGAFLSGGLDSSAIVALASEHTARLTTCTIRFLETEADESEYARAVAQQFSTDHHEVPMTVSDLVSDAAQIVKAIDQPSIDGFNTFFISRAAAQLGLKVVLSGLGGDELFGGYPTFRGVPRMMRALRSARALAPAGLSAHAMTRLGRSDRWRKVADGLRRPVSPASAYLTFRGLFAPYEANTLLSGDVAFDAVAYVADVAGQGGDVQDWVTRAELRTYTANQLLRDADAMSMAHSLELRVPLLDTRLVDAMVRVPAQQRLAGQGQKPLLRDAVAQLLPKQVVNRREKKGFAFPMGEWLRKPEAAALFEWDSGVFDMMDAAAVREVRDRFQTGRAHWARAWSLILLNEWYQQVVHV